MTYRTLAGDTFDILALDAYNDEFLAGELIRANPQHAGVVVFEAGVELTIPALAQAAPGSLPPWTR